MSWRLTLGLSACLVAIASVTVILAGGRLTAILFLACSALVGIITAFAAGSRYEREAAHMSRRNALADRLLLWAATGRVDVPG